MGTVMYDAVINEMQQIKDKLAAQYNYDVYAFGKALQAKELASGRKLVSLPPKRVIVKP